MPFEFIGNIKRNYLNKKSKIPQKNLIIVQFWWELCLQWAVLAGGPLLHLYCYLWFVARNPGKRQKPQSNWDLNWKSLLGNLYIFHFQRENFSQVFAFDIETIFLGNLHLYAIRSLVASNPRAPLENPPLVSSSPPSSNPSVAIPFPPPSNLIRLLAFLFIALLIYVSHQNR